MMKIIKNLIIIVFIPLFLGVPLKATKFKRTRGEGSRWIRENGRLIRQADSKKNSADSATLSMPSQTVASVPAHPITDVKPTREDVLRARVEFLEKYAPPAEMAGIFGPAIQEKISNLRKQYQYIAQIDDYPQYIFKIGRYAYERVVFAERMRQCIKLHNLTCLDVPRKFVYFLEDTYVVIADYIETMPIGKFTSEETRQLALLIKKTGISDLGNRGNGNIVRSSRDGKLYFIDTEMKSFQVSNLRKTATESEGLERFLECLHPYMDDKDIAWLKEQIDLPEHKIRTVAFCYSSEFNEEFDFKTLIYPLLNPYNECGRW